MRKFSSYGPVDKDLHYYVPRTELMQAASLQLLGEKPQKGGRYITVWAPRQCGKTWLMREVAENIRARGEFEAVLISMQSAKTVTTDDGVLELFRELLEEWLGRDLERIHTWKDLRRLFSASFFEKPLILIIDEFDALEEDFINKFANEFRNMYISRQMETQAVSSEKKCLLHGLALIGVRSVLGIENVNGSPFNVQRSLNIPNLTGEEVRSMFAWYESESGQTVAPGVVQRVHEETSGQPGLVSWFGELLTETYNNRPDKPISMERFDWIFGKAVRTLPNNNILNIISKAKQEPYVKTVLELFRTDCKTGFAFDDPHHNFLYMNGVIGFEEEEFDENEHNEDPSHIKFSSPFLQKRLFHYFSRDIFQTVDHLYDPMTDIEALLGPDGVDIPAVLALYRDWLHQNRDWLLKDAPRRKTDLRIYEAVFHFNLYLYLASFFREFNGRVFPEFPTGNGKVDLLIRQDGRLYVLELKSFSSRHACKQAIYQASRYAAQLEQKRIFLIFFIESIDGENRRQLESAHHDAETGVTVEPVFVETGDTAAVPGL